MALTMNQRKAVTREVAKRYKKATKKEKAIILNELTAITSYNRSYASRVPRIGGLIQHDKPVKRKVGPRIYDKTCLKAPEENMGRP